MKDSRFQPSRRVRRRVTAATVCLAILLPAALASLASCGSLMGGAKEAPSLAPPSRAAQAPVPRERAGAMQDGPAPSMQAEEAFGPAAGGAPAAEPLAGAATPRPGVPAGPAPSSARRRVYSGSALLLVDDVAERKRAIALLAEEQGGYVEATYERAVVVRVPAARFQEVFERLLTFGEVQRKAVETQDVTEAWNDLQARLGLSEKTRERLYALLEKTSDVGERLAILREIKRLSEEIERFRLTLELLDRQIAFSRISVELVPRLDAEQQGRQGIPFRWIAALDPVSPSIGRLDGRLTLELGDGFAVFSRERFFRAESPDGTRVRVGTTANDPRGDADFWRQALLVHLGRYYRSAEPLELGGLKGVLLRSKDRDPFTFLVGVAVQEGRLHVFEAFFPNEAALQRRLQAVREALGRAKVE